jgi:FK506-binding nuclear protein
VDDVPAKSLKRARDADAPGESPKPPKSDKKKKLKGDSGIAVAAPEIDQEKKKEKKKEKFKEKGVEKQESAIDKKLVEREITGGIKVLDSKIGTGPMAKKGNKVRMRYIGKLPNGTVFDKNVKGKPVCHCFLLVV